MIQIIRTMKHTLLITLLALLLLSPGTQAQNPLTPSASVSLLTSSPWDEEAYALFGHTSLRVRDDSQGIDLVFNYGLFDFDKPHFIYHFVRGETDYQLGASDFLNYEIEYHMRNLEVTEQVLNLSLPEKNTLWKKLLENYRPENREYRYNFFFDNCATRPLRLVENSVEGKVTFAPFDTTYTFRQLVEQCTGSFKWLTYGINLVLGAPADDTADTQQTMFLPYYLMKGFEKADIVQPDGNIQPLVARQNILIQSEPDDYANVEFGFPQMSPLTASVLLLIATILLAAVSLKKNIPFGIYESILFGIAGTGGIILFFLSFFSEHPCIFPNWNILWLQPLQWIVPIIHLVKRRGKLLYFYHFINFVALLSFVVAAPFIKQTVPPASVLFVLSLMICSVRYLYYFKKHSGK
ncbi:MAG: DUF4105 domain-containing protein [Bacteroidales bacterium]|nr:DUF4105 domain-containing protein [Bacteroidales bacterium]